MNGGGAMGFGVGDLGFGDGVCVACCCSNFYIQKKKLFCVFFFSSFVCSHMIFLNRMEWNDVSFMAWKVLGRVSW